MLRLLALDDGVSRVYQQIDDKLFEADPVTAYFIYVFVENEDDVDIIFFGSFRKVGKIEQ